MAHLGVADLASVAHAAYGRELRDVARLRGGSKKGVYRLVLDDGTTGIACVWSATEDYWPLTSRIRCSATRAGATCS